MGFKKTCVCLIKAYNSPDLTFDLSEPDVHYLNLFKKNVVVFVLFFKLCRSQKTYVDGLKIQYYTFPSKPTKAILY